MGVILFTLNRVDDAIVCFKNALHSAPGYPDAQHDLEIALQKKQQDAGITPEKVNNTPPVPVPQSPFIQTPGAFTPAATPAATHKPATGTSGSSQKH
jgi:hypothetical protein